MFVLLLWGELLGYNVTFSAAHIPIWNRLTKFEDWMSTLLADPTSSNPIMYKVYGDVILHCRQLAILALAASEYQIHWYNEESNSNNPEQAGLPIPSILSTLPSLGNVRLYAIGLPSASSVESTNLIGLSSTEVWAAGLAWARQHGAESQIYGFVDAIATLLYSTDGTAPLFGGPDLHLGLPTFSTTATFLLPMTISFGSWEDSALGSPAPAKPIFFVKHAFIGLLYQLGFFEWIYLSGILESQYSQHISKQAEARAKLLVPHSAFSPAHVHLQVEYILRVQ